MRKMLEKLLAKREERIERAYEGLTEEQIMKKEKAAKFKLNLVLLAIIIVIYTSQVKILY